MKTPEVPTPGVHVRVRFRKGDSDLLDVRRLQPLRALRHLEGDRLALVQGLVAVPLDGGEVNEDVRPVLLLDETVPLAVVEPFHFTCRHRTLLFIPSAAMERARLPRLGRRAKKKATGNRLPCGPGGFTT